MRTKPLSELSSTAQDRFFDLSIDMFCVADLEDGYFKKLNPAFEKTLGFSLDELYSRQMIEFVHPDDIEKTIKGFETQRGGQSLQSFEHRMLCKDGSYRLLSWQSNPDGHLIYAVARDITEARAAQEQAMQTQALFKAIVENMPHMLFIKDAKDLRFIHFNRTGADLVGYTPDFFIGKNDHDLFSKDEADAFTMKDREVLASGRIVDIEEILTSKNYGQRILSTKKMGIRTQDGREYLLGISNDITSQKRAENDLINARALAEDANRAKSEFIANMSHEIRTPLNGVIGITDLLMATGLNEEQQKLAQVLQGSGTTLLTLIHDILDFSKIEAGKLTIESLPFDIQQTLESQLGLIISRAHEKAIRVEISHDTRAPSVVEGDPARIGQVLMNLFGNAIKFTDVGGSIKIRTQLKDQSPEGAVIEYCVEDNGIGISESQIANLFTPFTQADGTMARKYGGTGLGLSISKKLVELMNGQIGVRSTLGQGSEFWFTIALKTSSALAEPQQILPASAQSPPLTTGAKHILVAEDNSVNQLVIKKMLKNIGYTCHVVNNGAEALAAYKDRHFDLVLMDCQMPEMDGYEASRLIRLFEAETSKRTPILAFTANVSKEDRLRVVMSGMDDMISKPVKSQNLAAKMTTWLINKVAA